MGRYMIVVLKKKYRTDTFIQELNLALRTEYGAPRGNHFVSEKFVQEEAHFFNTHPEGLRQIPHFPRPITVETLIQSFFWYRIGEFHCKISGDPPLKAARIAIAVAKWIIANEEKFINKRLSRDYDKAILGNYLDQWFDIIVKGGEADHTLIWK